MHATHVLCPHCRAPISRERFEVAGDTGHAYRICPECDAVIPLERAPSDAVENAATAVPAA